MQFDEGKGFWAELLILLLQTKANLILGNKELKLFVEIRMQHSNYVFTSLSVFLILAALYASSRPTTVDCSSPTADDATDKTKRHSVCSYSFLGSTCDKETS